MVFLLPPLSKPVGGGFLSNLCSTICEKLTFNRLSIVKAFVPEPHGGWDDVVLGPFPQGLRVETKPLLHEFGAVVSAVLQCNRVLHFGRLPWVTRYI